MYIPNESHFHELVLVSVFRSNITTSSWRAYIIQRIPGAYLLSWLVEFSIKNTILFFFFPKMTLRGLATPIALFAALVQGYANPGSCSGACNVHDPSLIQRTSDGKYFRFSTGNKISYASASSIKGPWTTIGSMLPSGSSINLAGNTDLWV